MKKRISFVFLLLIAPGVFALGISPPTIRINFEPNLHQELTFRISSQSNKTLELFVEGKLAEYVSLDKQFLPGQGEFTAIINLPEKLEAPGDNLIFVGAQEVEGTHGEISAKLRITSIIRIRAPYEGKYIDPPRLSIEDTNINEKTKATLSVQNFGTENITMLNGIIDVFDQSNNKLASKTTDTVSLKTLDMYTFETELNTEEFKPGSYKGVATVFYDGSQEKSNEVNFRVGELIIHIRNYTKEAFADQINSFEIEIESGWNNEIQNIFAELTLEENGGEITSFRTISTNLNPWEIKNLEGFLDATDIIPGEYNIRIEVAYENKLAEEEGTIIIKKSPTIIPEPTLIIAFVIVLIIISNVIWFIKSRKPKGKKSKPGSILMKYFLNPIKKRKQ